MTRNANKARQNPGSDKTSPMKESNPFNPSQNETELKIPFFLNVTLRQRVIRFRHFGTIFWPHLQGSKHLVSGHFDPYIRDHYHVSKRREPITHLRGVES